MAVFTRAGYEAVAPAIIQPAGLFLDVVGESLRARTYVFTDPDGDELCLRPDLTVPTCRLHLERHPGGDVPARYCYNGAAFRFQPAAPTARTRASSARPASSPSARRTASATTPRCWPSSSRRCARRACEQSSCASATSASSRALLDALPMPRALARGCCATSSGAPRRSAPSWRA